MGKIDVEESLILDSYIRRRKSTTTQSSEEFEKNKKRETLRRVSMTRVMVRFVQSINILKKISLGINNIAKMRIPSKRRRIGSARLLCRHRQTNSFAQKSRRTIERPLPGENRSARHHRSQSTAFSRRAGSGPPPGVLHGRRHKYGRLHTGLSWCPRHMDPTAERPKDRST